MSIQQNFPSISPSLSLNFARSKTLDPRITFSRTSTATRINGQGLIEVIPANSARFDHSYDPVSGTVRSLGLLVEESRSNLITYSEEFDDASWSLTNSSILKADIISPDGSKNAYILKEDTSNGEHAIRRASQFFSSGVSYTASFFVKKYNDSIRKIEIRASNLFWGGARVVFNPTNGEIEIIGSPGVVKIDKLNNGWYRVCITTTATTSGSTVTFGLGIYPDNDRVYTGDGVSGIYIWGAQLEQGSFPTSYIPTSGSTVTRTADNVSMRGDNFSSWYNQSEGSFFGAGQTQQSTLSHNFYGVSTGIFTGSAYMVKNSSNILTAAPAISPSDVNIPLQSVLSNTNIRSAFVFTSDTGGSASAVMDGGTVGVDSSTAIPKTMIQLGIGCAPWSLGTSLWNGTIAQLTYYPKRLPNAFLQNLTK